MQRRAERRQLAPAPNPPRSSAGTGLHERGIVLAPHQHVQVASGHEVEAVHAGEIAQAALAVEENMVASAAREIVPLGSLAAIKLRREDPQPRCETEDF